VVIPIHDKNPVRRTPYVTYALIALNFVVFLMGPGASALGTTTVARACTTQRYFLEHGAIPHELVTNRQLTPAEEPHIAVATSAGPVACPLGGMPHKVPLESVMTAMFIHAGWLHLLGNMLFLYVFGNNVEDRLGRIHFLLFYLVGGYLATYAFAAVNPSSVMPLVGASGAIATVLGAYLYMFPKARVTGLVPFLFFLPLRFPAWLVLGSWFILQLPSVQHLLGVPTDETVAYVAHVAGFAAGFLYAALVTQRGRRGTPPPRGRSSAPHQPPPGWGPPGPYDVSPYDPRFPFPDGNRYPPPHR
jgi:membrane associated rhomboid family serine protease